MILLSHPTGNEFVRQATRALLDEEPALLTEFWTSVSWNEHYLWNRVLPRSVRRELGRRSFPHVGPHKLHCHPWREAGRLAAQKFNFPYFVRHEAGVFSLDAVFHSLDAKVASRLRRVPDISGVYAYEDGALATFQVAAKLGIKTLYELPIGYWRYYRELMQEEAILQPDWAMTLQGRSDSDEKLQRKDEELALATDIIVPSDFVRSTLRKASPLKARITVLPYGAPVDHAAPAGTKPAGIRLKVLFVGALSQRKGLSYLLEAARRLGSKIELTLVGRKPAADCPALNSALRAHRWIPSLSHDAILEEMSRHDVMVFPSLFEGFALVVLEAMSQGVPVITTPNSGALHSISDGEDGFIVPIRDVDAIVQKLEMLILDPARLAAMRQAAIRKAIHHSWEQYRRRFVAVVRQALLRETQEPCEAPAISQPQLSAASVTLHSPI